MASRLALLLPTALVVLLGSTPNPVTAQQNARRAADIELPPQHGGQFFMAPDNWTHVEGAVPQSA